jgi:hypothetical protein
MVDCPSSDLFPSMFEGRDHFFPRVNNNCILDFIKEYGSVECVLAVLIPNTDYPSLLNQGIILGTVLIHKSVPKRLKTITMKSASTKMLHESDDDASLSSSDSGRRREGSSNAGYCDYEDDADHQAKDAARREKEEVERLIESENKEVMRWRIIVLLMLVSTAAVVTYFSHQFLQREDRRDFEVGVSTTARAKTDLHVSCSNL